MTNREVDQMQRDGDAKTRATLEEAATKPKCVCGEYWPCTDSVRTDIRPDIRAGHYVRQIRMEGGAS